MGKELMFKKSPNVSSCNILILFQSKASATLISKRIWDNSSLGNIKGILTPSESGNRGQSGSLNKQYKMLIIFCNLIISCRKYLSNNKYI